MEKKCESCDKEKESTKERTIKENGVLGYYDREVKWCNECANAHNRYLVSSWGQD